MALLPDHRPVHFTWRGVRRRVARADGPERIYGEWVRSDAELWAVRDYFVVEDEAGLRFWLFRAGDGRDPATGSQRWFLHGLFAGAGRMTVQATGTELADHLSVSRRPLSARVLQPCHDVVLLEGGHDRLAVGGVAPRT